MTYPSFPLAGNKPVWLVTIDPSFMGPLNQANALTAITGAINFPGPGVSGGLPIIQGGEVALTPWSGNATSGAPAFFCQRFGKRYNWVLLNGLTYGSGG